MKKPAIEYTLDLTRQEAYALIALVGSTAGDEKLVAPYRDIYAALSSAGVPSGLSAVLSKSGKTLPTIELPLNDTGFRV
jgi:hypothetical protein